MRIVFPSPRRRARIPPCPSCPRSRRSPGPWRPRVDGPADRRGRPPL
ncbi:MAG: hypothetical protein MZU84_01870 [Sphingobacterium sp.]|nr:hypothetical protein [Sphingobacterium sp.]